FVRRAESARFSPDSDISWVEILRCRALLSGAILSPQGRSVVAMKLPRRQFLHLAGCAAALPAVSRIAGAQAYPTRPVRLVVGYPAGGANSTVARFIAQWLEERLAQPFIVENRPGAANNLATEAVVRAPNDGYTLLLADSANAINATLYDKLSFNFI